MPPPIGPYTAGPPTSRVRRVDASGRKSEIVIGRLPSSQNTEDMVAAAADVALIDDTAYILIAGAGCSHGLPNTTNGVLRLNPDGTTTVLCDLSAYWKRYPAAVNDPDDLEPDGTPYAMIAVDDRLYVLEAHGGTLEETTPDGSIRPILDPSESHGHVVPTAVTYHKRRFYLGTLHGFPVRSGAARVHTVSPYRELTTLPAHLTALTALAIDKRGQLYALETTIAPDRGPVPNTGRIVRLQESATEPVVVATGLSLPAAMTFDDNYDLYVSYRGFGHPPGAGRIPRMHQQDVWGHGRE